MTAPDQVRVVESLGRDPCANLALEEWLFSSTRPGELVLYLWRNAPTVMIGRHQNPWLECRVADLRRDGVRLARRTSGGGAVFHDPGNTNFSFATQRPHYDVKRQIGLVADALRDLGIDARTNDRNDILVDGRKVSGSAYFGRKDRWLHHGTLLIEADLARLSHYLAPAPAEIRSKGVASVRARVANLAEFRPGLDHAQVCGALAEQFGATYGSGFSIERVDPGEVTAGGPLAETAARHAGDAWLFGRTPVFSHRLAHRFPWGVFELRLDVKRGVVQDAHVSGDPIDAGLVDAVRAALRGAAYGREDMGSRVLALTVPAAPHRARAGDVARWLAAALPS